MSLVLQGGAFLAGALCYATYFNRGEHHMYGTTYITVHTTAFASFTALLYRLGFPLVEAGKQAGLYDGIFLAGLFTSLFFYRAFMHPLNVFPGPWMARISSFYMTGRIQRMRMYKALQELHEEYGYFVRIGTQELSITHPSAVQEIFGADSVCQKSPHAHSFITFRLTRLQQTEPKAPDVMSALFVPYRKKQKPFDDRALNLLAGESHLLINAGSDTTRVTMACTLFTLAQQPELANRLREALAPYVDPFSEEILMDDQIMDVDLLNGVVQEALRMYPPSPSHPTRVTPPEGTNICGRFIPGGTQLITPQYVIGRDERVFAQPNEFIPERWYSRPELIKVKNATAPFSLGPMNCVGKQLAMANVRVTIATLVMRYNFKFAPSRDDPVVAFEQGMHEHFSMQPGPLFLCMERREK